MTVALVSKAVPTFLKTLYSSGVEAFPSTMCWTWTGTLSWSVARPAVVGAGWVAAPLIDPLAGPGVEDIVLWICTCRRRRSLCLAIRSGDAVEVLASKTSKAAAIARNDFIFRTRPQSEKQPD